MSRFRGALSYDTDHQRQGAIRLWFMRSLKVATIGVVAVSCLGLAIAPKFFLPEEDAAILYQYADNFAKTGIISYNEGGLRAEGGTDFLWLILLAAARYVGMDIFSATGLLNAASTIGIGFLLVRIGDLKPTLLNVAVAALVPLLSVQIWAAISGFSVLPFGFLLTLCAYAYCKRNDILLAPSMLLLCLFRPDGIVFAVPLAALRLFGGPNRFRTLSLFVIFSALPGILYFAWRWHYFGELLPLPFLVKSDAARAFGPFTPEGIHSIRLELEWCLPFLIIFLGAGWRTRLNIELLVALVVVPSVFYASMRLDQNWADRFYFYFVVATAALAAINWYRIPIPRWALVALIVGSYILFMAQPWRAYALERFRDRINNFAAIAQIIHADGLRGTLALSDAGRLDYYTRWPTNDLWGLNTAQFAHHLMQPQDLLALDADLVEVYFPQNGGICRQNPAWNTPYRQRTWDNLSANIIAAMSDAPYALWMVPYLGRIEKSSDGMPTYLSPKKETYNCIYIKDSYKDREKLIGILKEHGALTPEEYAKQLGPAHNTFE